MGVAHNMSLGCTIAMHGLTTLALILASSDLDGNRETPWWKLVEGGRNGLPIPSYLPSHYPQMLSYGELLDMHNNGGGAITVDIGPRLRGGSRECFGLPTERCRNQTEIPCKKVMRANMQGACIDQTKTSVLFLVASISSFAAAALVLILNYRLYNLQNRDKPIAFLQWTLYLLTFNFQNEVFRWVFSYILTAVAFLIVFAQSLFGCWSFTSEVGDG
jgi:hypothetical protein